MTKYTVAQIEQYRTRAIKLGLSASDNYWKMPTATLAEICNGYGPDRWPESLRDVLTWIYRHMPIASQIHDERYEASNGMADARFAADEEMLANMRIEVKSEYPLWKIHRLGRRWAELAKAEAAYLALRRSGSKAWMDAYQKKRIAQK
jgi:hypothetical protein